MIEQYSNDDDSRRKGISPHAITTAWLVQNCYIDTSSSAYNFSENQEDSSQYCEVCKHCKLNYRKVYCYTNKGKDRQRITICIDCLRRYEEKRYRLYGRPTGVVAITAIARVEEMMMTILRMVMRRKKDEEEEAEEQEKQSAAAMIVLHTANGDATINTGEDNEDLFYDAVALTYDISPMVREYFHNDRSRTQPDNKQLWPIRYEASKEFGI